MTRRTDRRSTTSARRSGPRRCCRRRPRPPRRRRGPRARADRTAVRQGSRRWASSPDRSSPSEISGAPTDFPPRGPLEHSRAMIRAFALLIPLLLPAAAAAQSTPPGFAQLEGPAGCLIWTPVFRDEPGCAGAAALSEAQAAVLTPDGAQLVVPASARGSNGIAVLQRDPQSGGMTFGSCVTDDGGDGRQGSEDTCADGDALGGARSLAFSPDGAFAYVAASVSSGITWLSRDSATGRLTPAGCIKQTAHPGEHCTQVTGLGGASSVALSADGAHVYLAAPLSNTITVFKRDAASGGLTKQSCISQNGSDGACTRAPGLMSPFQLTVAGAHLYVLGQDALATLAVDASGDLEGKGCLLAEAPAGGACESLPLLSKPAEEALAADGRNLLVTNESGVLISFGRDPSTGALTREQCFTRPAETDDEDAGEEQLRQADCEPSHDWAGPLAISGDGRAVFTGGTSEIAAYRRDPENGRLTPLGCVAADNEDGACSPARWLGGPSHLLASADGRNIYAVDSSGAVTAFQLTVAITSARASGHGALRVGLACPAARLEGCAGRLTGARTGRFQLAAGRTRAVSVRLTKAQRSRVRHHRRVTLALSARVRGLSATTRRVTVRVGPVARVAKRPRP